MYFLSSGPSLVWGNSAPTGYESLITLHSVRSDNQGYTQTATPNGWGYCGTTQTGTGSNWDQNTVASTGYACLDMPGRGQGDLITGSFPSKVNSTNGIISWTNEALDPVYEWADIWQKVPGFNYSIITAYQPTVMIQNQDYYNYTLAWNGSAFAGTAFNGSVGTGSGTLASRPATCTTGVAYWATDQGSWNTTNTPSPVAAAGTQGQLYICTATNTWTLSYTPFTYPHPLTATAPAVTLSPTSFNFGNAAIGATSNPLVVTLTNSGTLTLTISGIALAGANPSAFAIFANTCGGTLAPSANCTVTVTFNPATVSTFSALLQFTTNASTSPDNVTLAGTGVPSAAGATAPWLIGR